MKGAHSQKGGPSRLPYLLILTTAIASVFAALTLAEARVAQMVGPAYTRQLEVPLDGAYLEHFWTLAREAVERLVNTLSKFQFR
jgi:hypothetical protein